MTEDLEVVWHGSTWREILQPQHRPNNRPVNGELRKMWLADLSPRDRRQHRKEKLLARMQREAKGITVRDLARELGWTEHTTMNAMTRLRHAGLVKKIGLVGHQGIYLPVRSLR